jgi:hypothetical protein
MSIYIPRPHRQKRLGYQRVNARVPLSFQARQHVPDAALVLMKLLAICNECKQQHAIEVPSYALPSAMSDWERKHRNHDIEFLSPSRHIPKGFDDRRIEKTGQAPWYLNYAHNADIKLAYAADAAFTITLASLATSATWVAGREATSVSNGTNKYLDYEITGKITTGTTPTSGDIRLYGVKPINDTPTWPDVFDGTDSAETVTNTSILDKIVTLWSSGNTTTSDIAYPIISALTLAQAWGFVPDNFTIFVAHSTVAALNATGGNHEINYRGVYATST